MSRPPLEVADLIRSAGAAFIERNRQWIGWKHVKVLLAIARCRTAALGGHVDQCTRCGHRATIAAAIATAPSVRRLPGTDGSARVRRNFSRRATFT
jgi:Transposase zinc-binding domain